MVFDKRARRGTMAVSAGVLIAAFNMAAVAHAAPDTTVADGSPAARGAQKSATSPSRSSGPVSRVGSARDGETKARRDRTTGKAPVSAAAARRAVPIAEPVSRPRVSPALTVATPVPPVVPQPAAPLQSTLALTTMTATASRRVSPLGTPEQTAAETMAMRTANSLPMLAAKAVLGLAWRITGGIEYADVGGPDPTNLAALGKAVDEYAMASAFQSMILNSNDPRIVMQVAPPHQWYGIDVTGSRILYDNPDTIYRFTGVNYASQYVITGRMPENDPKASFSVLTGLTGTTASVLNADQLELAPDRTFVITVSGSPAQPGQTNHVQITPDTTLIAIRDTLSDWNTEDPMGLAIQRTAGPPNSLFSQFGGFAIPVIGPAVAQNKFLTALVSLIPPLPGVPPILRGSIAGLLMLRGIPEQAKYIRVATTDPVTGNRKPPNVFTDPTSNASFLATQVQSAGYFQLSDDQALVLTINPNNAGYFVVPVTNDWTITENYWDEQTTLNNAQARPNPDGSYTLVVSPTEPTLPGGTSVWNWVSTGGLNQGTIAIRFQSIDGANPVTPTVSSQVVPLSELAATLPAGTVLVTPVEREAQIAARAEGFNRRFDPYPQTSTG
jgi:hypothetical protein